MPIILDGTAGIDNNATDLSYTGTLTGGTGVVNLGSGQLVKDANGNVGIGTSSPTAPLHVSGVTPQLVGGNGQLQVFSTNALAANVGGKISLGGVSGEGGSFDPYGFVAVAGLKENATATNFAGYFTVATSNSGGSVLERMRIDSAGNVGIGTSAPEATMGPGLHIASTSGNSLVLQKAGGAAIQFRSDASTVRATIEGLGGVDGLRFLTGAAQTERARIDSSGNLLVGVSSFSAGAGGGISMHPTNNGRTILFCGTTVTTSTALVAFVNPNGQIGSISTNGSATTYSTSSDYRLKGDVQPVANAVDRLKQLKPVNFAWKVDGSRVDGFLAHEAQEVVPEAVTGTKDAVDADGKPDYQGIDQSKLVPLLTAALQEAIAEIESLKARLDAANI